MQSEKDKQQSIGFWAGLLNALFGLFKVSPVEKAKADVIKTDDMVEKAEAKVEVKEIKKEARQQVKINNRIAKARKAIEVSKLKKGKLVYVQHSNEKNRRREVFIEHTDTHVITNKGEHLLENVFNWHGRPVINTQNK